jgi:AraC-like DNA-binding protein
VLRAGETALVAACGTVRFATPRRRASVGVSVFFPASFRPRLFSGPEAAGVSPILKIRGLSRALDEQAAASARLTGDPKLIGDARRDKAPHGSCIARDSQGAERVAADFLAVKRRTRIEQAARLLPARTSMDAEIQPRLLVAEIAERFGFTQHEFARLFARAFGVSLREFCEVERLRRAAD